MKRCWEEAHRLGTLLDTSTYGGRSELAADLRELDRHFEVPQTQEEQAMHSLLDGVVAALEAGAPYPANFDDDAA